MQAGTVKWFNNAKGYGFIVPESGGEDVFVHYSTIDGAGFKTLKEGQVVHYDASESPRGVQTTRVMGNEDSEEAKVSEGLMPSGSDSGSETSGSETSGSEASGSEESAGVSA